MFAILHIYRAGIFFAVHMYRTRQIETYEVPFEHHIALYCEDDGALAQAAQRDCGLFS